ncbi:MAG: hypothetical protein FWG70_05845 [Oscillospiraceae bacterium]|nr:hypothetical protein [Oscillospiraceae bacterium]
MKNVLSAGLCLIIAGVLLAGCAGNIPMQNAVENEALEVVETSAVIEAKDDFDNIISEGLIVSNVEEQSNEVEKYPEKLENIEWREGFYEYKGITFPGKYYKSPYRNFESFIIDKEFLYSDVGYSFYCTTSRVVLAYITGDYERLSLDLCETVKDHEQNIRGDNLILKSMLVDIISTTVGNETISIDYSVVVENYELMPDIIVETYLNDNSEWKITYVGIG